MNIAYRAQNVEKFDYRIFFLTLEIPWNDISFLSQIHQKIKKKLPNFDKYMYLR